MKDKRKKNILSKTRMEYVCFFWNLFILNNFLCLISSASGSACGANKYEEYKEEMKIIFSCYSCQWSCRS